MKTDIGLLLLRLGAGGTMLVRHGVGKLMKFPQLMDSFPDPLGVGSMASVSLTVFAEVFCAAALVVGFATRLATIPLFITMSVAFFIIHGSDPFAKKELAFVYGLMFLILFFTGGGRFSFSPILKRFK